MVSYESTDRHGYDDLSHSDTDEKTNTYWKTRHSQKNMPYDASDSSAGNKLSSRAVYRPAELLDDEHDELPQNPNQHFYSDDDLSSSPQMSRQSQTSRKRSGDEDSDEACSSPMKSRKRSGDDSRLSQKSRSDDSSRTSRKRSGGESRLSRKSRSDEDIDEDSDLRRPRTNPRKRKQNNPPPQESSSEEDSESKEQRLDVEESQRQSQQKARDYEDNQRAKKAKKYQNEHQNTNIAESIHVHGDIAKMIAPMAKSTDVRKAHAKEHGYPYMVDCSTVILENTKQLADHFLKLINPTRGAVDWSNVIIGKSLFSTYGRTAGFEKWVEFSQDNATKRTLYQSFGRSPRTIRSLAWFAMVDNKDQYFMWHSAWCAEAADVVIAMKGSNLSMGVLLARFCWLTHGSADIGGRRQSYSFRHHGLDESAKPEGLNNILINNVYKYLAKLGKMEKDYADQIEKIIQTRIGDNHDRIAQEANALLVRNDITEYFKSQKNMLRFSNTVVETTQTEMFTRPGMFEDCLVIGTGRDYPFHLTVDSRCVKKREQWLLDTFGPELAEDMSIDMASFARGGNENKIFRMWVGNGDASKSMHVECLGRAYGKLLKKIPVTAFSGKAAGQGSANSELARTEGAFIVVMQEPESNEVLHGGRIKAATAGADTVYIRNLYEDGREMVITWKLISMTNHETAIGFGGHALANRVRVTPYASTWSEDASDDPEIQRTTRIYKMDLSFADSLDDMADAYWFMTKHKYYKMFTKKQNVLKENRIVAHRTRNFNRSNEPVMHFWDSCIALVMDGIDFDRTAKLAFREISEAYKHWKGAAADIMASHATTKIGDSSLASGFFTEALNKSVPWSKPNEDDGHAEHVYYGVRFKPSTQ